MPGRYNFPKRVRLLRSTDFRRCMTREAVFRGPLFAAFCLRGAVEDGSRIGFTVPRALGKAVVRNRIKRRMREAVRFRLDGLKLSWSIVINPRSRSLTAPTAELEREVERPVSALQWIILGLLRVYKMGDLVVAALGLPFPSEPVTEVHAAGRRAIRRAARSVDGPSAGWRAAIRFMPGASTRSGNRDRRNQREWQNS